MRDGEGDDAHEKGRLRPRAQGSLSREGGAPASRGGGAATAAAAGAVAAGTAEATGAADAAGVVTATTPPVRSQQGHATQSGTDRRTDGTPVQHSPSKRL